MPPGVHQNKNPPGSWPGGLFLSGVKKVVFQELALAVVIQEIVIMEPLGNCLRLVFLQR